jgi:hypothetical protein
MLARRGGKEEEFVQSAFVLHTMDMFLLEVLRDCF